MPMPDYRPHPLFYDALSGEFTPSSDPQKRNHTLARLAYATATRGRWHTDDEVLGKYAEYTPSWVPNDQFWSTCDESGDTFSITDDPSERPGKSNLPTTIAFEFETTRIDNKPFLVVRHETGAESPYHLELGSSLITAREDITELAQDFFDRYEAF